METIRTDFLVVGSGIAGLSFAWHVAKAMPRKKITLICKAEPKEGNTRYAQGGIAVAVKSALDSPRKHVEDTLAAGDGLCNEAIVRLVVREGPARLNELLERGVQFDRTVSGGFDLVREGGHSANRVYHRGDFTGLEIERKMLASVRKCPNIHIVSGALAIDLITNHHVPGKENNKRKACYGAFVWPGKKKKVVAYVSPITMLATGGIGQLFEHTTNSELATGDGVAMAYRAGAAVKNMAFVQFHPTAMYDPRASKSFLLTEALRGFGALLRNSSGEAFMKNYHPAADLATRDVVARAIKSELQRTNDQYVWLDCRHISKRELAKHFPTVLSRCASFGIDLSEAMIPVAPSAHYSCGGVSTDKQARTNLDNLYACGECAETGLHGANRLASNSLLEALVFAQRAATSAQNRISKVKLPIRFKFPVVKVEDRESDQHNLIQELKSTMSSCAEIICSNASIRRGLESLKKLQEKFDTGRAGRWDKHSLTFRNMLQTAELVLEDMSSRKYNAGVVFNIDRRFNNKSPLKNKQLTKRTRTVVTC